MIPVQTHFGLTMLSDPSVVGGASNVGYWRRLPMRQYMRAAPPNRAHRGRNGKPASQKHSTAPGRKTLDDLPFRTSLTGTRLLAHPEIVKRSLWATSCGCSIVVQELRLPWTISRCALSQTRSRKRAMTPRPVALPALPFQGLLPVE